MRVNQEEDKWEGAVHYFRKTLDVDVKKAYEELREIATVPVEKISSGPFLSEQINEASKRAHRAHVIYLVAKRRADLYEIDFKKAERNWTRIATARIAGWYEVAGFGKKVISREMIEQEIIAGKDCGDEYKKMKERLLELRGIEDLLKNFAQLWSDRRSSLQTQASLVRSRENGR
jgi:hypothetical protein